MNSCDYNAVTYDGEVYCTGCLPDGISVDDGEVDPIFAGSEWEYIPTCDHCGATHDYVSLIGPGHTEPREDDLVTYDHLKFFTGYGKVVLTIGEDDDMEVALSDWMDAQQFWPEVWFISDHGNARRIDL
jgi:hypothetical protein